MAAYRIYTVGDDHLVFAVKVIEARSDEQAMAAAEELLKERDLEIWTGMRKVGTLTARFEAGDERQ